MKMLFIFFLSFAIGLSATWTVTERAAITINAGSNWKVIEPLGIMYKGESGTILSVWDDWIEAPILKSKSKDAVGRSGFIWIQAVDGSNIGGTGGYLGAALCDRPGNDLSGKIVPFQRLAYLWPGDLLGAWKFSRPTWYLLDLKTKSFTGKGWVYAPYGAVK